MRYNKFLKIALLSIFVITCACTLLYNIGTVAAQEKVRAEKEQGKDIVKENKTLSGKVGFINSEFIAIIDSEGEGSSHETLFYLDEFVNVERKDSLSEIKYGDTVQIQYEKTTRTLKDARKSKKVVKGVKFLREAQEKTSTSTLKSGKK